MGADTAPMRWRTDDRRLAEAAADYPLLGHDGFHCVGLSCGAPAWLEGCFCDIYLHGDTMEFHCVPLSCVAPVAHVVSKRLPRVAA